MKYNPKIHQRKSIRLKGYDYSQAGLYFVTICCQNREHMYGRIENGKMILNEPGLMIEKWYYELENKFPDIKCREMVVMPNHFHCIIENVGADPRVCPNINKITKPISGGQSLTALGEQPSVLLGEQPLVLLGEHVGSPLHSVVQWFKTMSTNEYIRGVKTKHWQRFDGKLWQRNYWEHIIRNEKSYYTISDYIRNNPQKWDDDLLNITTK